MFRELKGDDLLLEIAYRILVRGEASIPDRP